MTTRLYYSADTAAPGISPAFDASWERTTDAVRRNLENDKIDTDVNAPINLAVASGSTNTPAGASDILIAQYISGQLSGSQTISGAIKGRMRASENTGAADMRTQCVVRVVDSAGTTVRGTLIASDGSALASEWATSITNRKVPLGSPATPTSVAAQDGDRIVVEVGYRKHENATTSRTGTIQVGAILGATDLPEDETTTAANAPWIEFADTLVFKSTVPTLRVSQATIETLVQPTTQQARVSQAVVEVLVTGYSGTVYPRAYVVQID